MFTLFIASLAVLLAVSVVYAEMQEDPSYPILTAIILNGAAILVIISLTAMATQEYMSMPAAPAKAVPQGPAERPPGEVKAQSN